nr:hypothetical protein CFP56_74222 [Quercus suber]
MAESVEHLEEQKEMANSVEHLEEEEEMEKSVENLEEDEMVQMLMEAFLLARSQNLVRLRCGTYYLSNRLGLSKWLGPFNRLNSLEKKVEEISADLKVVKEKIISLSDDVKEIKGRVDATTMTKATVVAYPWLIEPGQLSDSQGDSKTS